MVRDAEDTIQSVQRVAAILAACTTDECESIRDLAGRLGMSKSAAHRLLSSLEGVRFLSFNPVTQRYSLGDGLLRFAAAYPSQSDLVGPLREPLARLRDRTGETVCLHRAVGWQRMPVYQCESPQDLRYATTVGSLFPLYVGASGRCLLSLFPTDEFEAYLSSQRLESHTRQTVTDPDELRALVRRVRATGVAVSRGERVKGAVGVAAPIAGPTDQRLAVGIYGPQQRLAAERLREVTGVLRETVEECTAALSVTHPPERVRQPG